MVIALGGKTKDVGPTMLTDGTACIINSMKKHGVKRVCTCERAGVCVCVCVCERMCVCMISEG